MKMLRSPQIPNGKVIYLVGFMASGKTSVGRMLAERLSVPFLDSDDLVMFTVGLDVPRIFKERGEEAFRDLESSALHRLSSLRNVVVATGGGAVLSERNRALMKDTGFVVWLDVPLEEAIRRAEGGSRGADTRPLLGKAADLYGTRIPLYSSIAHLKVDTAGKPLDAVCDEVVRGIEWYTRTAARQLGQGGAHGQISTVMVTPKGDVSRSYEVMVGAGILKSAANTLAVLQKRSASHAQSSADLVAGRLAGRHVEAPTRKSGGRVVLVSDPLVYCLYGRDLEEQLESEGFTVLRFLFAGDEASKNMRTVQEAYDFLAQNGVTRDTGLIAMGGGVVGDLAGFVAATYMRGIPFVQVPTTLLAQIDASVGGKVAVDHPLAKNLIGTFYHPFLVIADVKTLCSLPDTEYRQGLAEMVKYALIEGEDMLLDIEGSLEDILGRSPLTLMELVSRCVKIKAKIVSQDERDQGVRQFLNLGHTLGHALESVTGYKKGEGGLSHGDAVAIGLHWACRVAEESGLAEKGLSTRIKSLLERLGLPTHVDHPEIDRDAVLSAMRLDKKARAGSIRLVLPRHPGRLEIRELHDIPQNIFNETLVDALTDS